MPESPTDTGRSRVPRISHVDFATHGLIWSTVREDHATLERGLQLGEGDDVLSISAAGCSVLSFLLAGPRRVVAIDINPAEQALVQLKLEAIRRLDHDEFRSFMGQGGQHDRLSTYRALRSALDGAARSFWDAHEDEIQRGLLNAGRTEAFFRDFQQKLATIHSAEAIERLFLFDDIDEQARYFRETFATPEFTALYKGHFSVENRAQAKLVIPFMLKCFSHSSEYIDGIWKNLVELCTRVPLNTNFYLHFMLTSRYGPGVCGPPYLAPESFDRLKRNAVRMEIVTEDIATFVGSMGPETFNKANLSNVFYNMDDDAKQTIMQNLADKMRSGGRIVYWDKFACSGELRSRLRAHDGLAATLMKDDRTPWYGAFRIEEIL